MPLIEVKSKMIRAVDYNPSTLILTVQMHPRKENQPAPTYQYEAVSSETFAAMMAVIRNGESVGRFFLSTIKPAYRCTKITEKENGSADQAQSSQATQEDSSAVSKESAT